MPTWVMPVARDLVALGAVLAEIVDDGVARDAAPISGGPCRVARRAAPIDLRGAAGAAARGSTVGRVGGGSRERRAGHKWRGDWRGGRREDHRAQRASGARDVPPASASRASVGRVDAAATPRPGSQRPWSEVGGPDRLPARPQRGVGKSWGRWTRTRARALAHRAGWKRRRGVAGGTRCCDSVKRRPLAALVALARRTAAPCLDVARPGIGSFSRSTGGLRRAAAVPALWDRRARSRSGDGARACADARPCRSARH